jgi:hypothetical protein
MLKASILRSKKGTPSFNVHRPYAGDEHKLGQDDKPVTEGESISPFDRDQGQLGAGDRPLLLDIATESK